MPIVSDFPFAVDEATYFHMQATDDTMRGPIAAGDHLILERCDLTLASKGGVFKPTDPKPWHAIDHKIAAVELGGRVLLKRLEILHYDATRICVRLCADNPAGRPPALHDETPLKVLGVVRWIVKDPD